MIRCRDRTAYFYIGDDDDYAGFQYNSGFASNLSRTRVNGFCLRQSMSEPLLQISQYSGWDNHNIQEVRTDNRNEADWDGEAVVSQDPDRVCSDAEMSDEDTLAVKNGVMTFEEVNEDYNFCLTCGINWEDEQWSIFCDECGDSAMYRSCPECEGQCGSTWRRDTAATHRARWAKWKGKCRLQECRQLSFHNDDEDVTNAKDDI
ncbi:uncharacterized protein LOC106470241 [Limulus polyphemus]|uniref:Uncharacterized protein LOC106470241 n=1 Tax=Limulus polyphemus TaxID=6850 RepID=A0ABM1BPM5_LIMPO|nr:uncharacterized protein LOC106470241 [Limulus polyphemus]XP_022254552.1 uncharacterized protein LOC106470241 [Limulus polyphemus]